MSSSFDLVMESFQVESVTSPAQGDPWMVTRATSLGLQITRDIASIAILETRDIDWK